MQAPIGDSGVQAVPKSLQSGGFFKPRTMAPHSQDLGSGTERLSTANRCSASNWAKADLMLNAE